jgi:hypothetical protein
VALPNTDVSYNPTENSINTVNEALIKVEKKFTTRTSKLEKLIHPKRARSLAEVQKTTRPLTLKQRLQVRKLISKTRSGSRASKPKTKKELDPNFSMKMTRTQRNKLLKKKLRRHLLYKTRNDKKRSIQLDNVENIVKDLDEKTARSKKILLQKKIKQKLRAGLTKRMKNKFLAVPRTSLSLSSASSLRQFKSPSNLMIEKAMGYQQRNMFVD